MIETRNLPQAYCGVASNGRCAMQTDAPLAKGGGGTGFGAHELLEAALATCINMAVRMHASAHGIPLKAVEASVRILRPDEGTIVFEQVLDLQGPLSDEQRAALMAAADVSPVRQTLSKRLQFAWSDQPPAKNAST
jgi:putative redox protein